MKQSQHTGVVLAETLLRRRAAAVMGRLSASRTTGASRTPGPARSPEPSRRPRGASPRQDRPAPPSPDGRASLSNCACVRSATCRPERSCVFACADGLPTLQRAPVVVPKTGGKRLSCAMASLLGFAALLAAASVQAQESTCNDPDLSDRRAVWSATLTVGEVTGTGDETHRGFYKQGASRHGTLNPSTFELYPRGIWSVDRILEDGNGRLTFGPGQPSSINSYCSLFTGRCLSCTFAIGSSRSEANPATLCMDGGGRMRISVLPRTRPALSP